MAIQRVMMTDSRKEDVFYEEAIKTLRTNMQFSGVETKSIVITSCYPNEGKRDRKSTRLNSSHWNKSRMPSSA